MKYYDARWIRSCNRIFNFIMGGRSIGKSFCFKNIVIKNFLEKKEQFVYARRYQIDIDNTAPSYFSDIAFKYSDHEFKYKHGVFLIDSKIAGYAVAVSSFIKCKSISYPSVTTILFDEFLSESKNYLGGNKNPFLEPELCLNFYQSVARGYNQPIRTNVKFYFISNAVSVNNPHFLYYNLDQKIVNGAKKILTESIALEIAESKDIQEEIEKSQFGALIKNSRYGAYANDNKFYLDSNEFIENDLPCNLRYCYTLQHEKYKIGVWFDAKEGKYYVTEKTDPSCLVCYSLTNSAHKSNSILVAQNKNRNSIKMLKLAYESALVYFKNQRCKSIVLSFLNI